MTCGNVDDTRQRPKSGDFFIHTYGTDRGKAPRARGSNDQRSLYGTHLTCTRHRTRRAPTTTSERGADRDRDPRRQTKRAGVPVGAGVLRVLAQPVVYRLFNASGVREGPPIPTYVGNAREMMGRRWIKYILHRSDMCTIPFRVT